MTPDKKLALAVAIRNRILEEQRKYEFKSEMDWAMIAAKKILSMIIEVQGENIQLAKERFTMPTDTQIVQSAILFNGGKIEPKKLADMFALVDFIIPRLYENGDITVPASTEKESK